VIICVSKLIKAAKLNKKPKAPEQKEKKKLIRYQNFSFTLGRIKLFDMVIRIDAHKDIAIAVMTLKSIVDICCKSSFKKYKNKEIKKPKKAPIITIYTQSKLDIFNSTACI
jgi:hypothetical protein